VLGQERVHSHPDLAVRVALYRRPPARHVRTTPSFIEAFEVLAPRGCGEPFLPVILYRLGRFQRHSLGQQLHGLVVIPGCQSVASLRAEGLGAVGGIVPGHEHALGVALRVVRQHERSLLLDEAGLPTRYYLPREEVRTGLLRPTDTATHCRYKGDASYWSAQVGGQTYDDVVWSYEKPIPGAGGISGLMCFYPERVELTVSGEQPSSQAAAR
jgi:uncharacterized protein (DUF427 family)